MDGADWLRTQLTSFGCAACGEPYQTGRIRLLAERDGLYFVDLACAGCASQAVAIVTVELDDDDQPQADAGDLIQVVADPARRPFGRAVSTDDVLDVHRLLADLKGSMAELLEQLDPGIPDMSVMVDADRTGIDPTTIAGATPAVGPVREPRSQRGRERSPDGPRFAHASEAELARILDYYRVRWEYEPRTFPVLWNLEGQVVESFAPDFYLPDIDLWVELTTLRQSLVRKKNRKLRRMRELYPMIRLKLLYARDFRALMLKYGRLDIAASLIGTDGQVVPDLGSARSDGPTPDVARSDAAASVPDADHEP